MSACRYEAVIDIEVIPARDVRPGDVLATGPSSGLVVYQVDVGTEPNRIALIGPDREPIAWHHPVGPVSVLRARLEVAR